MSIAVVCMVNATAIKELEGVIPNDDNNTNNPNCVAESAQNNIVNNLVALIIYAYYYL